MQASVAMTPRPVSYTHLDVYKRQFEGKLNVHTEIGGYHVIAASCGRGYWYGDTTYDDDGTTPITILDWMKREIAAAAADDPTGTCLLYTSRCV